MFCKSCYEERKFTRLELATWQDQIPFIVGIEEVISTVHGLSSYPDDSDDDSDDSDDPPIPKVRKVQSPKPEAIKSSSATTTDKSLGKISESFDWNEERVFCLCSNPPKQSQPTQNGDSSNHVINDQREYPSNQYYRCQIKDESLTSIGCFKEPISNHELIDSANNIFHSKPLEENNRPIVNNPNIPSYSERELISAVRAICCGRIGTRKAAALYGIPRSTLRNRIFKVYDAKKSIEQQEQGGKESELSMTQFFKKYLQNDSMFTSVFQQKLNKEVKEEKKRTCQDKQIPYKYKGEMTNKELFKTELHEAMRHHQQQQHHQNIINHNHSNIPNNFWSQSSSSLIPPPLYNTHDDSCANGMMSSHIPDMLINPSVLAGTAASAMASGSPSSAELENLQNMTLTLLNMTSNGDTGGACGAPALMATQYALYTMMMSMMMLGNSAQSHSPYPHNTQPTHSTHDQIIHDNSPTNCCKQPHCSSAGINQITTPDDVIDNSPNQFEECKLSTNQNQDIPDLTNQNDDIQDLTNRKEFDKKPIKSPAENLFQTQLDTKSNQDNDSTNKCPVVKQEKNMFISGLDLIDNNSNDDNDDGSNSDNNYFISQSKFGYEVEWPNSADSGGGSHRNNEESEKVGVDEDNWPRSGAGMFSVLSSRHKKRGNYRKYNKDMLNKAIDAVRSGEMSVHKAGSSYGIPHSTLEYRIKQRIMNEAALSSTNQEIEKSANDQLDSTDSQSINHSMTNITGAKQKFKKHKRKPDNKDNDFCDSKISSENCPIKSF